MKTQFFLDSGDQHETVAAMKLLGTLHGQTTNPSLVAKHPDVSARIAAGNLFSNDELLGLYKTAVQKMRELLPDGSVSIEVYADQYTSAEDMFEQATIMNQWIPGAHIKLPITSEALKTARRCIDAGMKLNMTLCFTQQQAAAVYAATRGAKQGDVLVSPFIGRLDDRGQRGMDLIRNIVRMFQESGDGHVQVLAASARHTDHVAAACAAQADAITAPLTAWEQWARAGKPETTTNMQEDLADIPYETIDLEASVESYNTQHDLTDAGIERFANDWNGLIASEEAAQKANIS